MHILWSDTKIQICFHSPIHCLRVSVLANDPEPNHGNQMILVKVNSLFLLTKLNLGKRTSKFVWTEFSPWKYLLISSRWWFQIFFIFTPTWGRFPFWRAYFSNGLKPPTSLVFGFQDSNKSGQTPKEVGGEGREIHAGIEAEVWWLSGGFPGFKKKQ